MKFILKRYFIITLSVFVLTQIIDAISISGGWRSLLYASFILTLLVYIGKPLAGILMLPINILTLNLFSWIINILLFYVWTLLLPAVHITKWHSSGIMFGPVQISSFNLASWEVVVLGGITITFLIQILKWLFK